MEPVFAPALGRHAVTFSNKPKKRKFCAPQTAKTIDFRSFINKKWWKNRYVFKNTYQNLYFWNSIHFRMHPFEHFWANLGSLKIGFHFQNFLYTVCVIFVCVIMKSVIFLWVNWPTKCVHGLKVLCTALYTLSTSRKWSISFPLVDVIYSLQ